ncbi:hypothetical protein ACFE04_023104 [Oxalis oulophora]
MISTNLSLGISKACTIIYYYNLKKKKDISVNDRELSVNNKHSLKDTFRHGIMINVESDQGHKANGISSATRTKSRAPHGQKTDWVIHEYRLDDHNSDPAGI